jgi:hypothetical protein
MKVLRAIVASMALGTALVPAFASGAQMFVATGRDTLRSLPGVEVLIEPPGPALEGTGLTAGLLATEATRQLRAGNITVYESQRENPSAAKAYLYIHVNAAAAGRPESYAVAIQVQVRQTLASLVTESRVVNAMGWDSHGVEVIPAARLKDAVVAAVAEHVARFVDDWRAVH